MSEQYRKVVDDLGNLPDVVTYFEEEYKKARIELSMKGKRLESHASEMPGIVENRFSQLQEIESILEYLNRMYAKKRSEVFRKFFEAYQKALSSREAEKYVDGDPDLYDLSLIINEIALVRNLFLSLTKGLDQKSWMIGHITRLRVAGLDDARLD